MLIEDGNQGDLDREAVAIVEEEDGSRNFNYGSAVILQVIMEEEEGSSNVGYGYSATSWLQVEMVIVKIAVGYDQGEYSERLLLAALCDKGSLLVAIMVDGSIVQQEMHAAVEGIKGDLVAERLVDRRLKAMIFLCLFCGCFGCSFGYSSSGVLGL
ncbi:hypothetical protein B296_00049114 [Ensete ventricosum]|uniref:Uncharacterized protein n=1 Tax=Ensete ventricosum TaxID=4639 RepID=A0A426XST4_ENSVE|nr:hypothetical protein B296_00049114 [Ensete ventricosum]